MRKLAHDEPEQCIIMKQPEDNGGFVYGKFPQQWVRVSPPRKVEMTDEQRAAVAERLRNSRDKNKDIVEQKE